MPLDRSKLWENIVALYIRQKQLLLLGEELLLDFDTFIQPALEQKHALDHIMRAKAVEQGAAPELIDPECEIDDADDYACQQLGKAKGHLYRAFFDTADWYSVSMRESIRLALDRYSTECLTAVFPEYYQEHCPKIENASNEIARIRRDKDVEKKKDVMLREVREYAATLIEIAEVRKAVFAKIPSLEDYRSRRRRGKVGWLVGAAVVGAIIACLMNWLMSQGNAG